MARGHGDIIHTKNHILSTHALGLGLLGNKILSQFIIPMGEIERKKYLIIRISRKKIKNTNYNFLARIFLQILETSNASFTKKRI